MSRASERRVNWSVRIAIAIGLCILALNLLDRPAVPQDTPELQEVTPQVSRTVDKGLRWLLSNQQRDGGWGCQIGQPPSTGITALAMLSLMAGGNTPTQGEYTQEIRSAVNYLLDRAARTGLIIHHDTAGFGLLFDHFCATLGLAEVYGMSPWKADDIRRRLKRAVNYIVQRQHSDGGWGASGGSDLASTAMAWLALRSAHRAGISISTSTVQDVEDFVMKCATPHGGFSLSPGMGGEEGHRFFSTSAGLRILYGMGRGELQVVRQAAGRIVRSILGTDYQGKVSEWDYVGAFYAVQAFLHEGDEYWRTWFPAVRDQLLRIQNADGSWTMQYCHACKAFATALALLVLQTPHRLLPMQEN